MSNALVRSVLRSLWCGLLIGALAGAGGLVLTARADDDIASQDDFARVVALIDSRIEEGWQSAGIAPASPADDAEFLRRVSLDIVGRIPSAMQVREFLADASPDKRRRLVESLLDDPRYVIHFTNYWRRVLIPEVDTDFNARYLSPSFETWLRITLLNNESYQSMVREILSAEVSERNQYDYAAAKPTAFYATKEVKPENLAGATSRMFLGVRIECAQCHDHPFDHWTRRDFWGYSAFFAGLEPTLVGPDSLLMRLREVFGRPTVQIPDTDQFVEPTYLDGRTMARGTVSPRGALTEWIVADSNPYFARTAVNRMWGYFFGVGFVDPIDDFSDRNPPSHPQLLDELSREFVAHDYDMKFLIRAITSSRAYQLSSRQTDSLQSGSRLFVCMPLRGLTAVQISDSLVQATGGFEPFTIRPFEYSTPTTLRGRISELFPEAGAAPTERPTTVLQSLAFMNGDFMSDATRSDRGRLLGSLVEFPGFDTRDRIEALFLAALSRPPSEEERLEFGRYVDERDSPETRQQALADILWTLLNSSEFLYNH